MSNEKMLEECRAHWEKTKPDAVFADYWAGWQASRESLVIELPKIVDKEWANTLAERSAMREAIGWCKKHIEAVGVKCK